MKIIMFLLLVCVSSVNGQSFWPSGQIIRNEKGDSIGFTGRSCVDPDYVILYESKDPVPQIIPIPAQPAPVKPKKKYLRKRQ